MDYKSRFSCLNLTLLFALFMFLQTDEWCVHNRLFKANFENKWTPDILISNLKTVALKLFLFVCSWQLIVPCNCFFRGKKIGKFCWVFYKDGKFILSHFIKYFISIISCRTFQRIFLQCRIIKTSRKKSLDNSTIYFKQFWLLQYKKWRKQRHTFCKSICNTSAVK
jgi:hypothetical protein